jgi:hypothetical protein
VRKFRENENTRTAMGLLDGFLAQDAALAFCNLDDFGELVTFKFRAGGSKTVAAQVVRQSPTAVQGTDTSAPWTEVTIANNATTGVTSIDQDGDKVAVADNPGGSLIDRRIVDIIAQDTGAWHLKLR